MPRHPPCALLRLISLLERAHCDVPLILILGVDSFPGPNSQRVKSAQHPTFGCQRAESEELGGPATARATPEAFRHTPEGVPYSAFQKGGDPAAGSPTATLLRLRPSH